MVAVKGRLNSLTGRVTQDHKRSNNGEVKNSKNFKIFTEGDKEEIRDSLNNETKGKFIPLNSGSYLRNVSDSKSGTRNLENSKSKLDKPVKINVGRKVLADISNAKGSSSKTKQGKISRPRMGKSERVLYAQRDTGSMGDKKSSSSGKPLRGKLRLDMIQATAGNQTVKKSVSENMKATSYMPSTKVQGRNSIAATGRISARIPLHLTRKSLPVLKQASHMETSGMTKENSDKSEKFKGKHGFPVKPSFGRSIVPKPSNLSNRPWGNRVSDGFVVMDPRAQKKVDAGVLSRRSVKPIVKTTCNQRNSKSKNMFATSKLRSGPAGSSQKRQDTGSLSKDSRSVVPKEELVPKEVISIATRNTGRTTDIIAMKKSDRRNSYTCLLMSRSKDALPNIYDDRNHLEVCDYVDDIYQYYWVMEGQNPLLKNYMDIQKDITPQMRGILINWLIEVHLKFDLMEETLFLTVTLLDRYLSLESIKKNEMQLVGLTAFLLASKYEDFWHPRITDLISISAESYTRDQMLKMEKAMLKKLKFRLNEPTLYVFMLRFLKAAQSDTKFEHLAFYLIELCLVEYEALNYKPSMLCASAIYLARCTMQMTPAWTPLLAKHARYGESQIRVCAEMILKFHKAAKTTQLKVTYEKYMKLDYGRVAIIKPLKLLSV